MFSRRLRRGLRLFGPVALVALIAGCVGRFSRGAARLVALREVDGLTPEAAARHVGLAPDAAAQLLHRARRRLRAQLMPAGSPA